MRIARALLPIWLLVSISVAGQQVESVVPATVPPPTGAPTKPIVNLTPDANGSLSQEQMQQLFRAVAAKDLVNDKRQRDYTYIEREVQNKLDRKGNAKSTEAKTFEVLQIYGEQGQRLIEKDDKPLSPKDAAKEDKRIQKLIDKRKNESPEQRKKRLEKARRSSR